MEQKIEIRVGGACDETGDLERTFSEYWSSYTYTRKGQGGPQHVTSERKEVREYIGKLTSYFGSSMKLSHTFKKRNDKTNQTPLPNHLYVCNIAARRAKILERFVPWKMGGEFWTSMMVKMIWVVSLNFPSNTPRLTFD